MSNEPEKHKIAVFQNKEIRRVFVDGEWFFSVIDVVAVLTDSPDPGAYWRKLKQRLTVEGSQVVTFCHGLKLPAKDGKSYKAACANEVSASRGSNSQNSPNPILYASLPLRPYPVRGDFFVSGNGLHFTLKLNSNQHNI